MFFFFSIFNFGYILLSMLSAWLFLIEINFPPYCIFYRRLSRRTKSTGKNWFTSTAGRCARWILRTSTIWRYFYADNENSFYASPRLSARHIMIAVEIDKRVPARVFNTAHIEKRETPVRSAAGQRTRRTRRSPRTPLRPRRVRRVLLAFGRAKAANRNDVRDAVRSRAIVRRGDRRPDSRRGPRPVGRHDGVGQTSGRRVFARRSVRARGSGRGRDPCRRTADGQNEMSRGRPVRRRP